MSEEDKAFIAHLAKTREVMHEALRRAVDMFQVAPANTSSPNP